MPARSVGSGTVSFGLVSIPFKLFAATSPSTTSTKPLSFNTLHAACGSRVKPQLLCPVDNVVVEPSDTTRGFHARSGRFQRLHKACGSPLRQQLLCPVDNIVLDRSDTIRGFEFARDMNVKFTDEELRSLEAATDRHPRPPGVRPGGHGRPAVHREDVLHRPGQGR